MSKCSLKLAFLASSWLLTTANQLQQPGADFLLETQFIIASKMNFFLEFFFMGKLKKCWLWSKTPLSALPFSCTFSAGDLASSF